MYSRAGRTITTGNPDMVVPVIDSIKMPLITDRKVIVIASGKITDNSVFSNGLYQNIYLIYLMAEILGYTSFLLFNEKDEPAKRPDFLKDARVLIMEDIVKNPIPIYLYLEVGMSIDPKMKSYLKTLGARVAKLYLGNILNIDIETPMYYHQQNFAHHVVGETDEIWVSPHYEMHREYAASLNHIPLSASKIAAYLWDPCFLTHFGTKRPQWIPPKTDEPLTILIMEPNISFQKASTLPLLIVEAFHRLNPTIKLKVLLCNGLRFASVPYTLECFLPRLDIYRKGYIELMGRVSISEILQKYPSVIPICHNYNNEYNYMTLEFLYSGFPVLHNSPSWKDAGYYFEEESIKGGVDALAAAITKHQSNIQSFIAQAQPIIYRHSIYNPSVQNAWKTLLG